MPRSEVLTGTTVVTVTFKNIKTAKSTAKKYRCVVKAAIEDKEPEKPVASLTAEQAGASKITLTANTDIEADTITVKKGSTEVKVKSKEFTSDGKSATLTLENKIVAADYTVSVSNAAISANFKGELSKLASIEFTSDYAIVDGEFGTAKKAYTYYVALNQWKEDVTESTHLTVTSSAPAQSALKGKIVFDYSPATITAAQLNDPVTCVLWDSTSGVTAQKTLSISNKALVAEIEPYGTNGIYNANNKTLAVMDKYTESFWYMFRAKDQYGNYLDDPTKMTNADGFFASFSEGLTKMTLGGLTTKVVDGVTYFAYPLGLHTGVEAGTATLILVAGGSGKSLNAEIVVAPGNTVDKITVTAPSTVAAGDNIAFDYVALDKEGNEVTSYAQLKKLTINPAAPTPDDYGFYWTKVNGKAVLYFNTKTVANPTTSMGTLLTGTFLTTTYNSSMCSFSVKQKRYPAEIVGLKDTAPTAQAVGRTLELKVSDFKVVDQYGEAFDLAGGDAPAYGIAVAYKSGTAFGALGGIAFGTPTGATSTTCTTVINGNSKTKKQHALQLSAVNAGDNVYEFKLQKITGATASDFTNTIDAATVDVTTNSAKKITLSASKAEKYVSYEVTGPEMLFVTNDQNLDGVVSAGDPIGTPSTYQPKVSVVATDNTGAKVKLDASQYDFTVGGGKFVAAVGAGSDKITASVTKSADYAKHFPAADTTVEGTYVVTMNDGTVIEKTVKVSNTRPSIAKLSYGTKTFISPATLDAAGILKDIEGKDNYGFDLKNTNGVLSFKGNTGDPGTAVYPASVTITVTDFVYAGSHVTGNGSSDPRFYNVAKGDKFTVEVAGGSAKTTIAVVPKDTVYDNTTGIKVIMNEIKNSRGGSVSAAALTAAGVANVVVANESAYQAVLAAKTVADCDTLAELQAIVDAVNESVRIAAGVAAIKNDVANATTTSFSAIGVTGVETANLSLVQDACTASVGTLNSVSDIQTVVNEVTDAVGVLSAIRCSIVTNSAVVYVTNGAVKAVSCAATTTTNVVSTAAITAGVVAGELASRGTATVALRTGTDISVGTDKITIKYGKYKVEIVVTAVATDLDAATVAPTTVNVADIEYAP